MRYVFQKVIMASLLLDIRDSGRLLIHEQVIFYFRTPRQKNLLRTKGCLIVKVHILRRELIAEQSFLQYLIGANIASFGTNFSLYILKGHLVFFLSI